MSQDVDSGEDSLRENVPNGQLFLGDRTVHSCQLNSTIGSLCFSAPDQGCSAEGSNVMCKSPKWENTNEVSATSIWTQWLYNTWEFNIWLVPYMSFSFRSLTSVDNNRRWKLKVIMSPSLGGVLRASNMMKREINVVEMRLLIWMEMYVFVFFSPCYTYVNCFVSG